MWAEAKSGIEFKGLAVAGNGLVWLALICEGVAEAKVGGREFRIDFEGLAVAGNGLVQLVLPPQSVAEVNECTHAIGLDCQRCGRETRASVYGG